jgi:hypothetical protein
MERLDALPPDDLVGALPGLMQTFVETGPVTGKVVALVAEVDPFLLAAASNAAPLEQPALLVAASPAILRGEEVQHLL